MFITTTFAAQPDTGVTCGVKTQAAYLRIIEGYQNRRRGIGRCRENVMEEKTIDKRPRMILLTAIVTVLALGAAFFWNEARKEVVFLCGNFTAGVSQGSVLEQLQTGSFLSYQIERHATGSRISAHSLFGIGGTQCVVEFDQEDRVIHAVIE
jgi:hypothetical protein